LNFIALPTVFTLESLVPVEIVVRQSCSQVFSRKMTFCRRMMPTCNANFGCALKLELLCS